MRISIRNYEYNAILLIFLNKHCRPLFGNSWDTEMRYISSGAFTYTACVRCTVANDTRFVVEPNLYVYNNQCQQFYKMYFWQLQVQMILYYSLNIHTHTKKCLIFIIFIFRFFSLPYYPFSYSLLYFPVIVVIFFSETRIEN